MLTDKLGYTFTVGCRVVRAIEIGVLDISTVTAITNSNLYLNDSKVPIRHPKRLLIINHDPLTKMMDDHNRSIDNE